MRKVWLTFIIAGLMVVCPATASAVVLYDAGPPEYQGGFYSDSVNPHTYSGTQYLPLSYNSFALSADSTITGIEWWGYYAPGGAPPAGGDAFDYDIQSSPGGGLQPSGEITNGSLGNGGPEDTGTNLGGLELYEYDASVNISLPAGAYYLSIYDTVSNPGNSFVWVFSAQGIPTVAEWSYYLPGYGDANSWLGPIHSEPAFNLTGTEVPEPATLTLLGLGLAGLISRRTRVRRGQ